MYASVRLVCIHVMYEYMLTKITDTIIQMLLETPNQGDISLQNVCYIQSKMSKCKEQ